MKKIITVTICIGLLVAGCATGNYTWTPTAEEWAAMTPIERTIWSANERQARQNAANSWQNFWNSYGQQQQQQWQHYQYLNSLQGIENAIRSPKDSFQRY